VRAGKYPRKITLFIWSLQPTYSAHAAHALPLCSRRGRQNARGQSNARPAWHGKWQPAGTMGTLSGTASPSQPGASSSAHALCKGANASSAAEASVRTVDDGDSKRLPKASSKLMSGSSPLTEVPRYLNSIHQRDGFPAFGNGAEVAPTLPLAPCLFSLPAARGYCPRHFILGSQRSHQSAYLNLCDEGDTQPPSHATGPHRAISPPAPRHPFVSPPAASLDSCTARKPPGGPTKRAKS